MTTFSNRQRRGDTSRSERHARLDHYSAPDTQPGVRIFAACLSGPCMQGRRLCPSPIACQQAEAEPVSFWAELLSLLCFWRKS